MGVVNKVIGQLGIRAKDVFRVVYDSKIQRD